MPLTKKKTLTAISSVISLCLIYSLYYALTSGKTAVTSDLLHLESNHETESEYQASNTMGWVIGTISSNSGSLLASVQVCAYGENLVTQTIKKCQKVEPNGQFEMGLKAGSYKLIVTASQHSSQSLLFKITPDLITDAHFKLEFSEHNIRGKVISASGEAISNAQVSIIKDGDIITESLTDENGAFQAWSPTGGVMITAKSPNYAQAEVFTAAPTHDVTIKMFPGFSITGKVISKIKGEPIRGITVTANQEDLLLTDTTIYSTTDKDGNFLLVGLESGKSYLRVFDEVWTVEKSILVDIKESNQDPISIIVENGQAFTGQLSTNKGPCQSGQLNLMPISNENLSTNFTIYDIKNGRANFPALPISSYGSTSNCDEYKLATGPSTINLKETNEEEWVFERGLSLEVIVSNQAGRPVRYARLNLHQQNSPYKGNNSINLTPESIDPENLGPGNQEPEKSGFTQNRKPLVRRSASSNEKGYFNFGGLNEGEYVLEVGAPGLNATEPTVLTLSVADGEPPAPIKITLDGEGIVSILSQSHEGSPNSKTLFFALDESGNRFESMYSGEGRFTIAPLPLGRYQIFAYDNKNPKIALMKNNDVWISVEDDETIELAHTALKYTGEIKGAVYDHLGSLASNVELRVLSEKLDDEDAFYSNIQDILHGKQSIISDKNGNFSFTGLIPSESYQILVADSNGFESNIVGTYPGNSIDINLPTPQIFKGQVLLPDGKPSNTFLVQVIPESDQPTFEYFESTTGDFSLLVKSFPGPVTIKITSGDNRFSLEEKINLSQPVTNRILKFENENGNQIK